MHVSMIIFLYRKRITSTSQHPNDLVTMPKEDVVGGDMKFKSEPSSRQGGLIACSTSVHTGH